MHQSRFAFRCPPSLLSAALALPLCLTLVSLGDDDPMAAPPAPPAGAKDAPPAGQPAQGSGDKGVLGGPKVPPDAAKDAPPFGQGARGERGPGQPRPGDAVRKAMAEERVFMMTIEGMMDGFTPDQQSQIAAIRKDFEGKRKAWREANGEQLREIEGAMRERREGAGRPDPALVEKAEKLRATMPDSKEMQSKVFAVLSPEQQAAFKSAYAENEKRASERMRGRQQGGPGGPGGAGGPGGPGGPGGDGAPAGGAGGRGKGRGQRGDGAGGPPPKSPPGAEPPKDRNYGFDKPGAPAEPPPAP